MAGRTIIHCPKFTSNQTMQIITGSTPLTAQVRQSAVSIMFRLYGHGRATTITSSRTKFQPHSALAANLISPSIDNWDISRPQIFPPPNFSSGPADTTTMNELVINQHTIISKFNYVCFTDGSKLNNQTGAGLVLYSGPHHNPLSSFYWRLGDNNTVFQAEMFAISQACELLLSLPLGNASIAIFTDSLSSISALSMESSDSKLVIGTRLLLDKVDDICSSLSLQWIRGHSGIPGNELADHLAKKGSNSTPIIPLGLPKSLFKRELFDHNLGARLDSQSAFVSSNPLCSLLICYASPRHLSFFKSLNRHNSRIMTAFLDNKAPLLSFLHKIGLVPSPICNYCTGVSQDNAHILLSCPALDLQRLTFLGNNPDISSSSSHITPLSLLQFLLNIPLFKKYTNDSAGV